MLSFITSVFLLCLGDVLAQSGAASPERQRYAILTAYMLKGSKNVRYETMPMSVVDQFGEFLWDTQLILLI